MKSLLLAVGMMALAVAALSLTSCAPYRSAAPVTGNTIAQQPAENPSHPVHCTVAVSGEQPHSWWTTEADCYQAMYAARLKQAQWDEQHPPPPPPPDEAAERCKGQPESLYAICYGKAQGQEADCLSLKAFSSGVMEGLQNMMKDGYRDATPEQIANAGLLNGFCEQGVCSPDHAAVISMAAAEGNSGMTPDQFAQAVYDRCMRQQ